jgi:hypothetical protein
MTFIKIQSILHNIHAYGCVVDGHILKFTLLSPIHHVALACQFLFVNSDEAGNGSVTGASLSSITIAFSQQ